MQGLGLAVLLPSEIRGWMNGPLLGAAAVFAAAALVPDDERGREKRPHFSQLFENPFALLGSISIAAHVASIYTGHTNVKEKAQAQNGLREEKKPIPPPSPPIRTDSYAKKTNSSALFRVLNAGPPMAARATGRKDRKRSGTWRVANTGLDPITSPLIPLQRGT